MAILDIRGTHGSGKSWVVHQLLEKYGGVPIYDNNGLEVNVQLGCHIKEFDCAVLGKYNRVCGGCDGIPEADEIVRRVKQFAWAYKNVILEGILVSHTYKRYAELAKSLEDYGYNFLFLDTPLPLCISRVEERRNLAGNKKPLNPKNIIKDHEGVFTRVRNKALIDGMNVTVLNHLDPIPQILELLKKR